MESRRSYARVMDWECLEHFWRGSDVVGVLEQPFFGCTACSVLVPHPTVTGAVEAPQLLLVSGKGQHQENTQTNKPVGDLPFRSVLECLEKKLRKISSVVCGYGGAGPRPREADPLPRSQEESSRDSPRINEWRI